jgi:hypothetical protein
MKQIWRRPKTKTVERMPMTMTVRHDNFLWNQAMDNVIALHGSTASSFLIRSVLDGD